MQSHWSLVIGQTSSAIRQLPSFSAPLRLCGRLLCLCFLSSLILPPSSFSADTIPTLTWDVETARPAKQNLTLYSGETVWLKPVFKSYSQALTLSNATSVVLRYRTDAMTEATYYVITGAVDSASIGRVSILWTPDAEGTNASYSYDVRVVSPSGALLRCSGAIAIEDSVSGNPALTPSSEFVRTSGDLDQFTGLGGTTGQVWAANGAGGGYWSAAGAGEVSEAELTTATGAVYSAAASGWAASDASATSGVYSAAQSGWQAADVLATGAVYSAAASGWAAADVLATGAVYTAAVAACDPAGSAAAVSNAAWGAGWITETEADSLYDAIGSAAAASNWVAGSGYVTQTVTNGLASEAWVTAQGYGTGDLVKASADLLYDSIGSAAAASNGAVNVATGIVAGLYLPLAGGIVTGELTAGGLTVSVDRVYVQGGSDLNTLFLNAGVTQPLDLLRSVGIGAYSFAGSTSANSVAVGMYSAYETDATDAAYVGYQSGYSSSGIGNTGLGALTLYQSDGMRNVAIGYAAGNIADGSSNTWLGAYAGMGDNFSGTIALGFNASPTASYQAMLGGPTITQTVLRGVVEAPGGINGTISNSTHLEGYTAAEINATPRYVPRRGDTSAYDLTHAAMTRDGNWHDWDVSSIVPDGAKAVMLRAVIKGSAAGSAVSFRENGNTNSYVLLGCILDVSGQYSQTCGPVNISSARVMEYNVPATFSEVYIIICGWLL